MGTRVIASEVLANGLRTEFDDTYMVIRNRQSDDRIGDVMDLGIGATNRQHEFAYFEAAPHMEYWERGTTIPTDSMASVQFTVPVYEWGRRVPWSKWDRKDDQTQSLLDMARMAGQSAALLPERFFFDLITATAGTLPAVPLAPDGAAMYAGTTPDGSDRFGVSGGNTHTATGTTAAQIIADFYDVIAQFKLFQDGKGQPMLMDNVLDDGFIVIHPVELTEEFETAFLQKRQLDPSVGGSQSNLVQDASRNVSLWGTPRITGTDWYVFLRNPPKQATFFLDRQGVKEFTSLEDDNNSDHNRSTGEEYVQWESRSGAGISLPYATIKVA